MKILLVHNFYGSSAPSGENTSYEAELDLLKRGGHTVIEYTRSSDEIRDSSIWGAMKGGLATPWNPCSRSAIRSIIQKEKPDVMHVHNFFPLISPSIFYAAKGTTTATVFTLHNYRVLCANAIPMRDGSVCTECLDRRSILPALQYCCYRGSTIATLPLAMMIALHRKLGTWQKHLDAMITLTDFQRTMLVNVGLPAESMYIKPHFYRNAPAPVSWSERHVKAVYIGRLSAEKGPAVMIEAWKRLGADAPELEVIGDGPDMESLKKALKGSVVEQKISFSGQLSFEETQKRLSSATMLILPSLCFEGFPMVIREAFALGVPVIGSRLGSIPFIVKHEINGMLFEPGDSAGLAAVVGSYFGDAKGLAAIAVAARQEFDNKYTAEANLDILIKIYEAAILRRQERNRGQL
jgi:glycosyltransferase involved in cell wall biosynthesis